MSDSFQGTSGRKRLAIHPDDGDDAPGHLWLLRPTGYEFHYSFSLGCDTTNGLVVRASTEEAARSYAQQDCEDERMGSLWADPEQSWCRLVTGEGKLGVVIRDFDNG